MRFRKVRAALYWISTFLNVTLHCCTPAHAETIHGLSVVLLRSCTMGHGVKVNFGIFPAGCRVEVGGYNLCREGTWAGRIAVFDKGQNEPVAYIAPSVKSSFEALVWLDGFRSGVRLNSGSARTHLAFDSDTSSRTRRDRQAIRPR